MKKVTARIIKKITLPLLFLSFVHIVVYSQNGSVNIDTSYFNIDAGKKLILINKKTENLNSLVPESKTKIVSNNISYSFISPVSQFETGKAYKVTDAQNVTYNLYFTELPIININSRNTIVDEPRVLAHFSMTETDGSFIENPIGIEYRGAWTQSLPKKSFRIEFWDDNTGNETMDVSLLGMRNDDDWNLQAMYNEPLRLRSKINYELWQDINTLYYADDEPNAINGVNQMFVELFVNKSYQGVYALSERVDRKQLKLKKFKNDQIKGELYKGVSWGASTFSSLPQYNNAMTIWAGLEYEYPDENINWENIYQLVDFVINEDSISFYNSYPDKFNIINAVDYFIFLNLLRATDNTGKNIFIARYNSNEPYFYIPWDLDGTFGMIWNGTKDNTFNDILTNGLYKRLILDNSDNGFLEKLKLRWNELRTNTISLENIMGRFNTQFNYLNRNGVYERELMAWQNCEFFDYNNIQYTNEWLKNRLIYLDKIFNNPLLITNINQYKSTDNFEFKIFPNPANNYICYSVNNDNNLIDKISIFDISGQQSVICAINKCSGKIDISNFSNGVYVIVADFKNGDRKVEKLIIKK